MLADEGIYLASESSFHRVLRAAGQNGHRGRAKAPQAKRPPTTHVAIAPNQVWCWDMTFLPSVVTGNWFYLYLILDLYSRKIVGWEVHDNDSADHAAHLVRRTALASVVSRSTAVYKARSSRKVWWSLRSSCPRAKPYKRWRIRLDRSC